VSVGWELSVLVEVSGSKELVISEGGVSVYDVELVKVVQLYIDVRFRLEESVPFMLAIRPCMSLGETTHIMVVFMLALSVIFESHVELAMVVQLYVDVMLEESVPFMLAMRPGMSLGETTHTMVVFMLALSGIFERDVESVMDVQLSVDVRFMLEESVPSILAITPGRPLGEIMYVMVVLVLALSVILEVDEGAVIELFAPETPVEFESNAIQAGGGVGMSLKGGGHN
jgi:hypothetical protein